MAQPPGTVSKILWHFTGGPKWNTTKNCQERKPKPAAEAYGALLSILGSKELRLGEYHEVVKVRLPKLRYNKQTRKKEERTNRVVEMRSSPVCCLSDIPIAHLSYHAARYGKIAIGFHREAAVRHGFNPVFYSLYDGRVVRNVRSGFAQLRRIDTSSIDSIADDLESAEGDIGDDDSEHQRIKSELDWRISDLRKEGESIGRAVESARKSFRDFLAFVKTFARRDFSTIYCEREWRSTEAFPFKLDDVAMIVLPKVGDGVSCFSQFLDKGGRRLKLPRSIPVVPWEDLVEH